MMPLVFSRPPPRYRVPHDRIGLRLAFAIHQAVSRAFEMIRADGYALAIAGENQITERLENTLENRVWNKGEVEAFDHHFFRSVSRGSEVVNFDGVKISKKPDLVFKLRREHRVDWDQCQDAVFAECKPVDRQHSLTGHYCAVGKDCTGIERFIIGDYAWAMEEAFMIGYVRGGHTIARDLPPVLADAVRHRQLGSPANVEVLETSPLNHQTDRLHRTVHQRLFPWNKDDAATPIEIFHSWHECG